MAETKENDNAPNAGGDIASLLPASPSEMTHASSIPIKITRANNEPIDVYPWLEITVQRIDVQSQKWEASVELHLFWQDFGIPAQCPNYAQTGISLDNEDVQSPIKLSEIFENKLWERVEHKEYEYFPETSTMHMLVIVSVCFVERMELERFPMDRQFLGMDLNAWTLETPADANDPACLKWNWIAAEQPDWVPEEWRKTFAVRMLASITEYTMLSPWVDFTGEQPLSIRLRVEREPGYYLGSIILPNFLIVLAAFAAFPVFINDEDSSVADRLSITVTLMLTAVAFKYVITEQLPKITYLTIMDYYLLEGFIMLTLLIGENAATGVATWGSQQLRQSISNWMAVVFGVVWGLTHLWWMVVLFKKDFMRVAWDRMSELDEADDEDEFVYAPKGKTKGRPESKEVLDEWGEFKTKSPRTRASVYAEQHPELAKEDSIQL